MHGLRGRFLIGSGALAIAAAGGCGSSPTTGIGGQGGATSTPIVHPVFPPTRTQAQSPPAISGGTLLIAKNGKAVAADSDRDAVYVVDLASGAVTTIALQSGDEPGRLAEDDNGRVHVALRSGGALATIDLASSSLIARRSVCAAPRGVAYDPSDATVYVACQSGELVQLPAAGGAPLRTLHLDRDLRDVMVFSDHLVVTRFRSAESLTIGKSDGSLISRSTPANGADGRTPSVAWRTIADTHGRVVMLHQRGAGSTDAPVATTPGGYGGPPPPPGITCARSIVEGAVSISSGNGEQGATSLPISGAVVPVDIAESPDLHEVSIVAAGNAFTPGSQTVLVFYPTSLFTATPNGCASPTVTPQPPGQPVALAYTTQGPPQLVVQTREPAALFLPNSLTMIRLSNISREDTGHDIFHSNSGGNIACASCHPEGGDDSRVWSFDKLGDRRTPSLRGTVQGTAPYHWGGEMQDFPTLVADVFQSRMSGPVLADDQTAALSGWINRIPAPVAPTPLDPAAVARGKTLFEGSAACSSCHAGPKLTNNASVDVGTGKAFQVPSLLGVAYREPFMHDGCAATLKDRFDGTCGGDMHGTLFGLSDQNRADIIAYLQTL